MKWNQFFSTPWATNVEVTAGGLGGSNLSWQHENKYEQLLEEAKKLDLDEKSGCLLKVGVWDKPASRARVGWTWVAL